MDELAESEEQYQRNVRSHTETIDRLLGSYNERMQRKENNYRRMLNETLDQTDAEVGSICYQQNEDEISLQSITQGVQRQLEESLNNTKSIALSTVLLISHQNFNALILTYMSQAILENA